MSANEPYSFMTQSITSSNETVLQLYNDIIFNKTFLYLNSSFANNSANTTDVIRLGLPTWQLVLWGTLTAITSITTVVGNLVVILSFVIERTLRQPTNFFILSLAVSDLLIGLLSMPFYTIYLLAQHWMLGPVLCDLWLSIDYTVCLASIYTVFCITVDRFCSVRIPAKYRNWRTPNKVIVMVAVTWAVPAGVFFITIFGWQYFVGVRTVGESMCYVQYLNEFLFSCLLQVGYFWTTLVVMFILYALIYKVALTMSRKSEAKQKQANALVSMGGQTANKTATTGLTGDSARADGNEQAKGTQKTTSDGNKQNKKGSKPSAGEKGRKRTMTETDRQSSCALASDEFMDSEKSQYEVPPVVIISADNLPPPLPTYAAATRNNASLGVTLSVNNRSRTSSDTTSISSNMRYSTESPTKSTQGRFEYPSVSYTSNAVMKNTSSHVVSAVTYMSETNGSVHKSAKNAKNKFRAFLARFSRNPSRGASKRMQVYDNEATGHRRPPPCCLLDKEDSIHECIAQTIEQGSPVWQRRSARFHSNQLHQCTNHSEKDIQWAVSNHSGHSPCSYKEFCGTPRIEGDAFSELTPQTPRSVFEARRAGRRRARSIGESPYTNSIHEKLMDANKGMNAGTEADANESIQLLSKGGVITDVAAAAPKAAAVTTNKKQIKLKIFLPKLKLGKSDNSANGAESDGKVTKTPRQKSKGEHRALKALRTITIILGAFVLCWTPWHVLSLITGYIGYDKSPNFVQRLYDISYWLCYLNSPINPFCYAMANQQFKKTFIRIFKLDWHRT